jgi:hypothetical protein
MQGRQAQRGVGCSLASSRAGQNAAASAHAQHQRALSISRRFVVGNNPRDHTYSHPFGPEFLAKLD